MLEVKEEFSTFAWMCKIREGVNEKYKDIEGKWFCDREDYDDKIHKKWPECRRDNCPRLKRV